MLKHAILHSLLVLLVLSLVPAAMGQEREVLSNVSEDFNGILAACSSSHDSIYVLDKANNQVIRLDASTNAATSIALPSAPLTFTVHPNGTRLYVGMENNAIAVFDISSLPETALPAIQLMVPVKEIAVSALGDIWIDTKETNGDLRCYNSDTESLETSDIDNNVRLVSSPDGSKLMHHTDIGNVKISQLNDTTHCSATQIAESNFNFGSGTYDARWTPDGENVLVVNGITNRVSKAPVQSSMLDITQEYIPTNPVSPVAIAISADGRFLVTVTFKFNGEIPGDVIDTTTGEIVSRFTLNQFEFFADQEHGLITTGCGDSILASEVPNALKIYTIVGVTSSVSTLRAEVQIVDYSPSDTDDPDDPDDPDAEEPAFTINLRSTRKNIKCKVRQVANGKAAKRTRVVLQNAVEEAGPFTQKKSKRTNKRGLANFPLRGLKKGTFARCLIDSSVSNVATVKKRRKRR